MADIITTVPDFYLPEAYKNKEFFANMARYVVTKGYNVPFYNFSSNNNTTTSNNYPIDNIIKNWTYYLGEQNIGVNSALLNGLAGNLFYRPGLEINSIVNHVVGQAEDFIKNASVSSEVINKDAKSRKQIKSELILMGLDNKELFEELAMVGIMFNAIPPHIEIKSREEFEKRKEFTLKEKGEVILERICNKNWQFNDLQSIYKELVRQCKVAGICGIHNYMSDEMLHKDLVAGHRVIWDNANTDVYLNNARFCGLIHYRLSPDEMLAKWGNQLTAQERQEIRSLNRDANAFLQEYNLDVNGANLWCYPNDNNGISAGSAATVYMKGHRNMRYMETDTGLRKINDFHKNGGINKEYAEKDGDYHDEAIYCSTLIMNKYVVDYGQCENICYDNNLKTPLFPLQIVVPDITLDQYKSDVGKLRGLQDEIDYYANKIKELCIRDKGKNYIIRGKMLGITEPKEFFQDILVQNIHFAQSDGENPANGNTDFIAPFDLTLDPNVTKYVELKLMMVREMREVASVPDVAMGLQNSTIGKAEQENTIHAASTGLAPFYNTVINFMERDLQVGANMNKMAFASDDFSQEAIEETIGTDGLNYLKVTEKYPFEFYGVKIKLMDIISSTERKEMKAEAFAALQVDPSLLPYMIKLRQFKSLTEAENYLDYVFAKKEEKEAAQQQAILAQQAAAAQQANEAQVIKSTQTNQTLKETTDRKAAATEYTADKSLEGKVHGANTQAEAKIVTSVMDKDKKEKAKA